MGEIVLVFKVLGVGTSMMIVENILNNFGNKNISTFINILGVTIINGLILTKLSELINGIIATFNLL